MKLKLYPIFNEWQAHGPIWLFSDPHFDDPESKKMNPNWPDADTIVKNINSKVGKTDTLIILGDVGDEEYVKKLKGYKVLITGNHDRGASNYKRVETFIPIHGNEIEAEALKQDYNTFKAEVELDGNFYAYFDNGLFDEVYEGPLFISDKILLSHEPIELTFGINIHGHTHMAPKSIYRTQKCVAINVCSDVRDFMPVRLDKVIEEFKVQTLHRQTIDRAGK